MNAVEVERRGAVLWARIARPERANACGSDVMAALEGWLEQGRDQGVRVLVLTGTGGSFCAGADLKEAATLVGDHDALLAFLRRGRDLVAAIREAPVPVIAAVNGVAYAGGLELLLACDVAVAGASAQVGDRHLAQGQVPGWGSSALLPAAVGRATATRLLLGAESLDAAEALRIGLVSEVVDDHLLDEHVTTLADTIALYDAVAVDRMLRLTRRDPADLATAAAWEWQVLQEHAASVGARDHVVRFSSPSPAEES
ncbi:enoyl-CoA hydratase/isomerase family protein [Nocardioides sp. SYSU D00038]|uniref:enoyl-CoA hydratase/isomerase family protein n=1 Tax=Nocardioides sp. SYSU D00038 TaxID=2812554 RepID=UPI00196782DE|nr:enoyl-CoA hydratase/isomerase family protein [Nocardioides sp. SYSU D00038]